VINLKTATARGLTIPQSLRVLAEVICTRCGRRLTRFVCFAEDPPAAVGPTATVDHSGCDRRKRSLTRLIDWSFRARLVHLVSAKPAWRPCARPWWETTSRSTSLPGVLGVGTRTRPLGCYHIGYHAGYQSNQGVACLAGGQQPNYSVATTLVSMLVSSQTGGCRGTRRQNPTP
jgi:hypothetical protein